MSIPVLLFASYAEALGARRLEVPLNAPCLVRAVVEAVRALPGGHVMPATPLVAINHDWVSIDASIVAGDELALIPPVAGG